MSLCPGCATYVAGALRQFNVIYRYPAVSGHTLDYLLHWYTSRCCGACNKAARRLRSIERVNPRAVRQDLEHSHFRTFHRNKRLKMDDAVPMYLRQLSFSWGCLSALRWLYRNLRTDVTVTEMLKYIPEAQGPARLECYLYLEAWRRGCGGHRMPSQPRSLEAHCAARVIQRRWRQVVLEVYQMTKTRFYIMDSSKVPLFEEGPFQTPEAARVRCRELVAEAEQGRHVALTVFGTPLDLHGEWCTGLRRETRWRGLVPRVWDVVGTCMIFRGAETRRQVSATS